MLSYESTNEEIENQKPFMAVQPLGSTEQHGPHLPVYTDSIIALEVSKAIAKHFKALLLPPIPYSCSIEHYNYISTVWLKPTTLRIVLKDVIEALKHHGFKVLVLVNGHGGNFILKNIVREMNYVFKNKPITILVDLGSPYFGIVDSEDIHAGKIETSLMLYLRPKLVKKIAKDNVPNVTRDYLNYAPIDEITVSGVWGLPSSASKKYGEELFNRIVKKAIDYVKNVLKFTGML